MGETGGLRMRTFGRDESVEILCGETVRWMLSVILAAVFIFAAIPKIAAPQEFALSVFRYHLLPHQFVNLAAIYLPWLELAAVTALLVPGRFRQAGVLTLLVMLTCFTCAIGYNLWRGLDIACGCFSVQADSGFMGFSSVLRNLFLILLCCWLFISQTMAGGERANEDAN